MGGPGVQEDKSLDFGVTLPEFKSNSLTSCVTFGKLLHLSVLYSFQWKTMVLGYKDGLGIKQVDKVAKFLALFICLVFWKGEVREGALVVNVQAVESMGAKVWGWTEGAWTEGPLALGHI